MNCRSCSSLLSAYRDNELTGREMLAVREHLSVCHECRGELMALESIHRALGRLNDVKIPEGLEKKIHGAVFQQKPKSGTPLQLAAWGGLAAAAAFCAFAVFQATSRPLALHRQPSHPTTSDLAYTEAADPLGVYVPVFSVSTSADGR